MPDRWGKRRVKQHFDLISDLRDVQILSMPRNGRRPFRNNPRWKCFDCGGWFSITDLWPHMDDAHGRYFDEEAGTWRRREAAS